LIKRLLMVFICVFGVFANAAPRPPAETSRITQEELVRRTQEMVDAVGIGDQVPWKKYLADDCMLFDERGRSMDKAALLKELAPLPKGYSGSIKIGNAQSRMEGNTAILSYDMDEKETVFGQELSARYHQTDTWMYRQGRWQVIASQVLRYYEDPAPGKADPVKFAEYTGTYQLAPGVEMTVSAEEGQLYTQRSGGAKTLLLPEAAGIFFRKGVEGRMLFRTVENGAVDALISRRNNEDVVWKKIK
jgi:Domain of unknown function (DUF4440)/Domain of unknown function (DUF3471)